MLTVPAPVSTSVVPSGTRVNFLSAVLTLGVVAVGGVGLLVAHSVAAIVTAAVLGLVAGMAPQVAQQWAMMAMLRMARGMKNHTKTKGRALYATIVQCG